MSGAVAAHASYNGSGTQGLAVTNKLNPPEGDVMSVFWNKNDTTRQLLYGSSTIEIASSGTGGTASFGGSQVFTINNDIDALGDIYVHVGLKVNTAGNKGLIDPYFLAKVINRVEFQVGTQVWQTLENKDLLALCRTELGEGAYDKMASQANGFLKESGTPVDYARQNQPGVISETGTYTAYLHLPILTKTLGPELQKFSDQSEEGYLMAAAPHQTVKIKLYYAPKSALFETWTSAIQAQNLTVSPGLSSYYNQSGKINITTNDFATIDELDVKLYGQHMIMCNEEREQMKAQPEGIPKRLKMTQNVQDTLRGTTTTVMLDHFSLYTSHLIITTPAPLSSVELLLNSSSFSGVLPAQLLKAASAEILGLYNNEFSIGPTSYDNVESHTYIFPLASRAYGGSSVPLNRFDNIRLRLTQSYNAVTSTGLSGTANQIVDVTAVGETTALYKAGAASLAMY